MEDHPVSPRPLAALRPLLDALDASLDRPERLAADPVELPRAYRDPADQEVAALFAASLAYGRADVFKPVLRRILADMGPTPGRFVRDFAAAPDARVFTGALYRFNRPADFAALAAAAGEMALRHGSLGARFGALHRQQSGRPDALRRALAGFAMELREARAAAPLLRRRGRRGLRHLLPDAAAGGAAKRWNLFLRWMVRGPDEVDLGTWRGEVPRSALVVPLDTHVHRVSRCLGLTRRKDASWRTAEEITAALRVLDPEDPVRFDFALCHLGMSGACPAQRDPVRCAACPLAPACGNARNTPAPRNARTARHSRNAREAPLSLAPAGERARVRGT